MISAEKALLWQMTMSELIEGIEIVATQTELAGLELPEGVVECCGIY